MPSPRLIRLSTLALLLTAAACATGEEPEPLIISTLDAADDTVVVPPEAVGMCAVNRRTGALEGQVVAVLEAEGEDAARYEVVALNDTTRAFRVRAGAVHLDLCERAAASDPLGEPLRKPQDP
jgi:hypothetical protein